MPTTSRTGEGDRHVEASSPHSAACVGGGRGSAAVAAHAPATGDEGLDRLRCGHRRVGMPSCGGRGSRSRRSPGSSRSSTACRSPPRSAHCMHDSDPPAIATAARCRAGSASVAGEARSTPCGCPLGAQAGLRVPGVAGGNARSPQPVAAGAGARDRPRDRGGVSRGGPRAGVRSGGLDPHAAVGPLSDRRHARRLNGRRAHGGLVDTRALILLEHQSPSVRRVCARVVGR